VARIVHRAKGVARVVPAVVVAVDRAPTAQAEETAAADREVIVAQAAEIAAADRAAGETDVPMVRPKWIWRS
jgi:hypothetical protein